MTDAAIAEQNEKGPGQKTALPECSHSKTGRSQERRSNPQLLNNSGSRPMACSAKPCTVGSKASGQDFDTSSQPTRSHEQ